MSSELAARLNARLGLKKADPAPNSPPDLGFIPSHRKTSNSRGPGQEGTVHVRAQSISPCPACGVKRYGAGVHAPHFNSSNVLVDCQGKAVAR